jgi:hypothetical protein
VCRVGDEGHGFREVENIRRVRSCSVSRLAVRGDVLAVAFAGVLCNLWPSRVPGFLQDRRDIGIGKYLQIGISRVMRDLSGTREKPAVVHACLGNKTW